MKKKAMKELIQIYEIALYEIAKRVANPITQYGCKANDFMRHIDSMWQIASDALKKGREE